VEHVRTKQVIIELNIRKKSYLHQVRLSQIKLCLWVEN